MLLQAEVSKPELTRSSEQESNQVVTKTNDENKKESINNETKAMDARIDRTRQRSVNSMWCGCLASGTEYKNTTERPITSVHTQNLPSSVIQSMESLSISRKTGSHSGSPADGRSSFDYAICAQPTINLPSCALITDALLSRSKSPENKVFEFSRNNRNSKYNRSSWSVFKMYRKRNKNDKNKKPGSDSKEIANISVQDVEVDVPPLQSEVKEELDQALVFSPLPSQIVPETPQPEKLPGFDPYPNLINKVDVNLLYTPRFDSLFRKHPTTLLGPRSESDRTKKCFVIDLDETLVHSSFKVVEHADFKVGVEIDGITHRVYVLKRPYVDLFLSTMANLYECVLFTASLAKYADPVADFLDKWNTFRYRLFRESCVYHRGNYVKDLSHLGRPINQVVILDNSPASYMFHASHAVQISSWFDDANDRTLLDLIPYFERLATYPNVVDFLRNNSPPTPYAAVGTVGLPPSLLPHLPYPPASTGGRSSDGNTVISNVRRPNVVSPLPAIVPGGRNQITSPPTSPIPPTPHSAVVAAAAPPPPLSTSPTLVVDQNRLKVHGLGKLGFRGPNPGSLPVITKLAAPNSGPTVSTPATDQPILAFPAPLSIASYVPVTDPAPSSLTTAVRPPSGSMAQTRLATAGNNPGQNSHNPCPAESQLTTSVSHPVSIDGVPSSPVISTTSNPTVSPKSDQGQSSNRSQFNASHNSRPLNPSNRLRPGFHNSLGQNHRSPPPTSPTKSLSPVRPTTPSTGSTSVGLASPRSMPVSTSPSLSLNRHLRH